LGAHHPPISPAIKLGVCNPSKKEIQYHPLGPIQSGLRHPTKRNKEMIKVIGNFPDTKREVLGVTKFHFFEFGVKYLNLGASQWSFGAIYLNFGTMHLNFGTIYVIFGAKI